MLISVKLKPIKKPAKNQMEIVDRIIEDHVVLVSGLYGGSTSKPHSAVR